ncbi:hypothetical protein ABID08_004984 [Rhizobium binae]|uniref:Uncharacterized protein n=1 Tax=Rhizobium binae TaxID=1138190 RepID=A0ABV2MQF8_9HYPH|nr:hypothetical protein [Rhizobium binae]MBX4994497.1 hypothetical protein [Rhizobium binae]NKL50417.1 hypothetical protein [Rhizobium leguminosarum bv. viciae]QSY84862.1 hypothetical protein J2J99_22760 [Rhizobium binae]
MSDMERAGWSSFRPSKTLWFWSIVGASVLTTIVGFTWGGWVTSGRASTMAELAVRNARANLVADMCVHNFVSSSDAAENLKALKAKSSWQREDFIKDGGWTTIAGINDPVANAADTCADHLLNMKELPALAVTDS